MAETDPTKNPEFQKVVRHFLTMPPQPHKRLQLQTKSAAGVTAEVLW
jgi:hypothetical protein